MAKNQTTAKEKKREFPDVYALVFLMCIAAMAATWIVPAGSFERVTEGTLTKVVAGSFQYIDRVPQTPWDMLQAIFQGCINSAGTIFMIMFCGAAVNMLDESKALTAAFSTMARKLQGKEAVAIGVIMFALGLGNAAGVFANIGTAIILIGVFMSRAMGGDAFLGFLIIYWGLQSGFSVGFANPSILGVAQTLAEVPIFSGMGPRVICCLLNITYLYVLTLFYFKAIKKDPTRSLNYEEGMKLSDYIGPTEGSADDTKMTKRQMITVAVFFLGVIFCVTFTILNSWPAEKIASFFIGLAVVTGILSGFSMNEIARKFVKGCQPMVYASFVTGLASAVAVILNNGKVIDTIVNFLSLPLAAMGSVLGAGFMVIINVLINVLVPSGSGQAAMVMPLMVPIADLVGITRQVAVQAFQFGDGLGNLITPLNGPMMGCLALVGVSFPKYIKWAFKFLVIQYLVAAVITMGLSAAGWVGF